MVSAAFIQSVSGSPIVRLWLSWVVASVLGVVIPAVTAEPVARSIIGDPLPLSDAFRIDLLIDLLLVGGFYFCLVLALLQAAVLVVHVGSAVRWWVLMTLVGFALGLVAGFTTFIGLANARLGSAAIAYVLAGGSIGGCQMVGLILTRRVRIS